MLTHLAHSSVVFHTAVLIAALHPAAPRAPPQVSTCTADVFRPGSTAPGAQLWDARDLFDQQNARCDKVSQSRQGVVCACW